MIDEALFQLSENLGAALAGRGWLLGTAESCTGGLVAGTVTAVPGSSVWFDRGFATYSNQAKIDLLGVTPQSLQAHGAVSEQVAREMAVGVLVVSPAVTVSVSITGVAGPGGATADKPVGRVCFGFARRNGSEGPLVYVKTCDFDGDRARVRHEAVRYALEGLLDLVQMPPSSVVP